MTENQGYNERLFQKGLRAQIHLARFDWLHRVTTVYSKSGELRVIELGCFDGRSIDWLPGKPTLYDGYDANWEGGLDIGRSRFSGDEHIRFHQCSSPLEMTPEGDGYDIGISLETMEHVPPEMVEEYLAIFARSVRKAVFFSIPNEIGIPFAGKFLAKKAFYRDSKDEPYSLSEFLMETLGQTQNVHRSEHKGFDYRRFLQQVQEKFDVLGVESIPYRWLPAELSFTIGIIAQPKQI